MTSFFEVKSVCALEALALDETPTALGYLLLSLILLGLIVCCETLSAVAGGGFYLSFKSEAVGTLALASRIFLGTPSVYFTCFSPEYFCF